MTHLEKTKLIDRYLSREMSEEERIDFERLLSEPDSSYNGELSLQKEMELQKEIELAIQERGLREMLQREEARIRSKQRIRRITLWSVGGGSLTTAVAAAMTMMLVVAPVAQQMQSYSNQYVAQVEVGGLRGDDECADKLNRALLLMQDGRWSDASAIIEDVLRQTANSQDEQVREMRDNAQWLKAVCLMHEGKVMKAKRLLRQIANSDSPYSQQAAELVK